MCCLLFFACEVFGAKAVLIRSGLDEPVCIASAPGDSSTLYVVERKGKIKAMDLTRDETADLLLADFSDSLETGFIEQGLLGLAFSPDYAENGEYYVNYTRKQDGATVVARCRGNRIQKILFTVEQPYANHNGGGIVFGPDGLLYIGMGDGGSAGDPQNNAQNSNTYLGKMLRVDVHAEEIVPEIYLTGLRNPWRFDFDPVNNDLYIADVGQDSYEEVNVIPGNTPRNTNLGWNRMEGMHCFPIGSDCESDTYLRPVWEYSHREGCSITAGVVVRDPNLREFFGYYICADYCSGRIWSFRAAGGGVANLKEISEELFGTRKQAENISAFGRDAQGRVYFCRLSGQSTSGPLATGGMLYRIETSAYGPGK
jgi:hypothetical protein